MKQLGIGVLLLACLGFASGAIYQQVKTTPVEVVVEEETDEIVLLNTATGKVTRSEWIPTPARDPQTGQRTIYQALYCSKCRQWHPAPPPEMAERLPGGPVCPLDQTRLTTDGPGLPD